jgi:hypothetical protein
MVGLVLATALAVAAVAASVVTGRLYLLGFLGVIAVVLLPFRKRS